MLTCMDLVYLMASRFPIPSKGIQILGASSVLCLKSLPETELFSVAIK